LLNIPIFFEVSKDVENTGLFSKFAKDWDVWIGDWFWFEGSSFTNSNLFGDDIFIAGVEVVLGFYSL